MKKTGWWWAGVAMIAAGGLLWVGAGLVDILDYGQLLDRSFGLAREPTRPPTGNRSEDERWAAHESSKAPLDRPAVALAVSDGTKHLKYYVFSAILAATGVLVLHRESLHIRVHAARP